MNRRQGDKDEENDREREASECGTDRGKEDKGRDGRVREGREGRKSGRENRMGDGAEGRRKMEGR